MATGLLVICKSNNNGEPLFPWERWFKKPGEFMFQRGVYYTWFVQDDKYYVINRLHNAIEIEPKYFNALFKKK